MISISFINGKFKEYFIFCVASMWFSFMQKYR